MSEDVRRVSWKSASAWFPRSDKILRISNVRIVNLEPNSIVVLPRELRIGGSPNLLVSSEIPIEIPAGQAAPLDLRANPVLISPNQASVRVDGTSGARIRVEIGADSLVPPTFAIEKKGLFLFGIFSRQIGEESVEVPAWCEDVRCAMSSENFEKTLGKARRLGADLSPRPLQEAKAALSVEISFQ